MPLPLPLFLPLLLLRLVADSVSEALLVPSDGAHPLAARPDRQPGPMPRAPPTRPMQAARRGALEPVPGVGHAVRGGQPEASRPMSGQGLALDQVHPLWWAPLPEDPPEAAAEWPIEDRRLSCGPQIL